eukprot:scaffold82445_cov29-Phaeocystis_antarctica.AAC.1
MLEDSVPLESIAPPSSIMALETSLEIAVALESIVMAGPPPRSCMLPPPARSLSCTVPPARSPPARSPPARRGS